MNRLVTPLKRDSRKSDTATGQKKHESKWASDESNTNKPTGENGISEYRVNFII